MIVRDVVAVSGDARVVAARDGDREVVLKIPSSDEGRAAMWREASLMAVSESPHFLGVSDGPLGPAVAMAHAGETLHDRALRAPLGGDDALRWIYGGIAALRRLHACGIAHGDVSPQNLTMDADGRVHAIDLGLATMLLPWTGKPGPRPARDWRRHVPDAPQAFGKGRPHFVSPAVHRGHLGTRRDDLVSLWLSVAWATTALAPASMQPPWMTLSPHDDESAPEFAKRVGRAVTEALDDPAGRERVLQGLPPPAREAFGVVTALGFAQEPTYDALLEATRVRPA